MSQGELDESHEELLTEHVVPKYPVMHLHVKPPAVPSGVQVPPFKHGLTALQA